MKQQTTNRSTREIRGEDEQRLRSEALNRFITEQAEAARDAVANIIILAAGLIFAALCLVTAIMGWQ